MLFGKPKNRIAKSKFCWIHRISVALSQQAARAAISNPRPASVAISVLYPCVPTLFLSPLSTDRNSVHSQLSTLPLTHPQVGFFCGQLGGPIRPKLGPTLRERVDFRKVSRRATKDARFTSLLRPGRPTHPLPWVTTHGICAGQATRY